MTNFTVDHLGIPHETPDGPFVILDPDTVLSALSFLPAPPPSAETICVKFLKSETVIHFTNLEELAELVKAANEWEEAREG